MVHRLDSVLLSFSMIGHEARPLWFRLVARRKAGKLMKRQIFRMNIQPNKTDVEQVSDRNKEDYQGPPRRSV